VPHAVAAPLSVIGPLSRAGAPLVGLSFFKRRGFVIGVTVAAALPGARSPSRWTVFVAVLTARGN